MNAAPLAHLADTNPASPTQGSTSDCSSAAVPGAPVAVDGGFLSVKTPQLE